MPRRGNVTRLKSGDRAGHSNCPYSVMAISQPLPEPVDAVLYCVRIGLPLQNSEVEKVSTMISIYRCEMVLDEAERIGCERRQECMAKGCGKCGEEARRERR